MAIHYFEEEIKSGLKEKRKLSAYIKNCVAHYLSIQKTNVNFIFCSDDFLLEKNKTFLNHDTLTDIITFDLSESDQELESEIYISIERVKENAIAFQIPYQEELHRVIFHGILHLCGFKDKTIAEQKLMREKEQACLNQYFEK